MQAQILRVHYIYKPIPAYSNNCISHTICKLKSLFKILNIKRTKYDCWPLILLIVRYLQEGWGTVWRKKMSRKDPGSAELFFCCSLNNSLPVSVLSIFSFP